MSSEMNLKGASVESPKVHHRRGRNSHQRRTQKLIREDLEKLHWKISQKCIKGEPGIHIEEDPESASKESLKVALEKIPKVHWRISQKAHWRRTH